MNKKLVRITAVIILIMGIFTQYIYATEIKSSKAQEELKSIYEIKDVMNMILNNYMGSDISRDKLTEAAIRGMFSELDNYSAYYNEKEYKEFLESVSGEFVGIGVRIQKKDDYVLIVEVLEKTPAERAELLPGDMIIKINDEDVKNMSLDTVLVKIKGTEGTKVKLTIKRGLETLIKDIGRAVIQINPIKEIKIKDIFPQATDKEAKYIRYLMISEFNSAVANEFIKETNEMIDKKVRGLIIDLRNNPGGYLDQVIKICQQIIPEGPIVHTIDKQGNKVTYSSELKNAPFDIVVLVNGSSASASEIMAGAIKDSGVGILVGEKTYGKGVVQKLLKDVYGNYFKLTVEEYLTRNGTHINKIGIEPDIVIEIPEYMNSMKAKYKLNDTADEIEQLEKILFYLGYTIKSIDKNYEQDTYDAIMKFQADNGLFPYGVADYTTQKTLNTCLSEKLKIEDKQLIGAFEIMKKKLFKK